MFDIGFLYDDNSHQIENGERAAKETEKEPSRWMIKHEKSQFNKIMIMERVFRVLELSIFRHVFFYLMHHELPSHGRRYAAHNRKCECNYVMYIDGISRISHLFPFLSHIPSEWISFCISLIFIVNSTFYQLIIDYRVKQYNKINTI